MRLSLCFLFLIETISSFAQRDSMIQAFLASKDQKNREAIGQPFPKFSVRDGKVNISNENLKGKVVLINFWFATCHPCLAEFDALNELNEKLKDNKNFEFISFTWEDAATIKRVKEQFHLNFKVLGAKDEECRRLNQNNGYPTNIILDKNGNIRYLFHGAFLDKEKTREFVMTKVLGCIRSEL